MNIKCLVSTLVFAVVGVVVAGSSLVDSNAELVHRWAFNGSMIDSVTRSSGSNIGAGSVSDAILKLVGGNKGNSYADLGQDMVPQQGPVTIEIWAKKTAVSSFARIIDVGCNTRDYFFMAWNRGTTANTDQIGVMCNNMSQNFDDKMQYGANTYYHISLEFVPQAGNSTQVKVARRNSQTGAVEKSYVGTWSNWTPASLPSGANFLLGCSRWNEPNAAAEYDEVRIWNRELTDNELTENVKAGVNGIERATIGTDAYCTVASALAAVGAGETVSVKAGAVTNVVARGTTSAGALAFVANSKIYIDLAGIDSATTTVLTAAGGITLPANGNIADYVRFPDEWYNSGFVSVTLAENNTQVRVTFDLDVPVTAEWTGAGDGTSFTDAANWTCRNVLGEVIADVLPSPTQTRAIFTGNVVLAQIVAATKNWQTTSFENMALAGDSEWSGLDLASLGAGNTVDLKGHKLTLQGFHGGSVADCAFTDTVGGGELHIVVPSGAAFVWAGASLTGTMALVKEGEGILELGSVAPTCTMEVVAGMANGIAAGTFDWSAFLAHRWSFNGDLVDAVGGTSGTKYGANSSLSDTQLTLVGGSRGNSYVDLGTGLIPSEGPVTIEIWAKKTAASSFGRIFDIGTSRSDYIFMAWNRDTIANTDQFGLAHSAVYSSFDDKMAYDLNTFYHIVISYIPFGDGTTAVRWARRNVTTGEVEKSGQGLWLDWTPSQLPQSSTFWLGHSRWDEPDSASVYDEVRVWRAPLSVEQLTAQVRYGVDATVFQTAAALNGRGYFTMDEAMTAAQAGNTISVRASAGAHPVTIYKTTPAAVAFESGAKIFIDLAEYAEEVVLTADGGIMLPNGAAISDVVEFSDQNFVPQLSDDGKSICAVNLTIPVRATWVGGGETRAVTDPANWRCVNARGEVIEGAVPNSSYTEVTISGETTFSVPKASDVIWKSITIGSCSLAADGDWTGLGVAFVQTGTVDLSGHNLTIAGAPAADGFTDTATKGGELHVCVPANATYTNTAVTFSGSLALVKDGDGLFVASKTRQTYTGGTRIAGGTVRLGSSMSNGTMGADGTDIQIDAGGFLDSNGTFDNYNHTIVLNGGTLGNMNTTRNSDWVHKHFGDVRLTADSFMNFTFGGLVGKDFDRVTLDLQGHTLNWYGNDDWCWMNNTTITAGKVVVTGFLTIFYNAEKNYGISAESATIEVKGRFGIDTAEFRAGTYICDTTLPPTGNYGGTLKVYNCFNPKTQLFWGPILQNGATLDLSEQTGVWEAKSTLATSNSPKTVTFADNATITVDVGDRKLHNGDQVIVWTSTPANYDTLKFKLQSGRMGELIVTSTGVCYSCGLMIFVR